MNNSADSMNLLFFLSQFDFLSQKPTLLINNTERIRSFSGALLTLTVWIVTITMASFILEDFYLSGVPSVVKSDFYNINEFRSFDIGNLPIMFSFLNKTTERPIDLTNFQLNVKLITFERAYSDNVQYTNKTVFTFLNISNCSKLSVNDDIINTISSYNQLSISYNCIKQKDTFFFKFHEQDDKNNSYKYSEISLEALCPNCSQAFISDVMFSLVFMDDVINLKETKGLKKTSVRIENFPISLHSTLNLDIVIKQGTVITDVGLLKIVKESLDFLKLKIKQLFYLRQDLNNSLLTSIRISQDSIQENYHRHYTKLPMLIAQIGGIYYIIYMLASKINMIYSVVHFYLTIDNNTKVSYFLQKEEQARRKVRLAAVTNSVNNIRNINVESMLYLNQQQKSEDVGIMFIKDNTHKRFNYTYDLIESIMNEFKIKVRSVGRPISSTYEIFKRIICCDNKSEETKLYNKTVIKIREFLDVTNIIKLMIEFQFLKSIIFSRNVQKLFKFFSDVNLVNSEKLTEIQTLLKDIYNKSEGEEGFLLDQYAAQFFIENYMKN